MNMKKKILKFIFNLLWKSDYFQMLVKEQMYADVIYPHEQIISDYEQVISKLKEQVSEMKNAQSVTSDTVETVKPKRRYHKKPKTNK